MVINLDILIIENSIVNYFLLYITSQTLRIRKNFRSILLPAVFGGIYVITLVFPKLNILASFPFKIVVASLMILLLFKNKSILLNVKALFIYLLYSMLLAGVCFFIEINNSSIFNLNGAIYNFSYKKLMLSIIILYLLLNRLVLYIKDRIEIDSLIYTVDIVFNDVETTVRAFLDTGNELREPVTNLPVMILESFDFRNKINENEFLHIPYKVVNGQVNNLKGFRPSYIRIHKGNELETRQVIVGLCDNKLSSISEYNALLSRGII